MSNPRRRAPQPKWSPTELGEQVFFRFHDAGNELPDLWASGPADKRGVTAVRRHQSHEHAHPS